MWLKRLVGVVMIITCIGMNILVILGLTLPDKAKQQAAATAAAVQQAQGSAPPVVSITADPSTIPVGSMSILKWSATNAPASCTATGSWAGTKPPNAYEKIGPVNASGNYTFVLSCTNTAGTAQGTTVVTVGSATPPAKTSTSTRVATGGGTPPPASTGTSGGSNPTPPPVTGPTPAPVTYCGGRLPCYGPHDVGQHSGQGNCWGWNGSRVINISGFDAAYHEVESGISSIQISTVCGHDLAPGLSGQITVEGQSHDHNQTTKDNADVNEIPYFVGYFDASKP